MMSASSFLNHLGSRPPRYRTPSPPRRAIEPITPSSTADFRTSWAERIVPRTESAERDQSSLENGHYATSDGGSHNRSGHGRSGSTMDALATVALATSPTFAPLSYRPPSQSSTPAFPLFHSESADNAERPAKRPRSEKNPSPFNLPSHWHADAAPHSHSDSMKTDAELLLNLARPSHLPPMSHQSKRVSTDESRPYEDETRRHSRVGFNPAYMPSENERSYGTFNPFPPSRTRSQSDGSTFSTRPVICDVRPSTSSSTLAPIPWQEEAVEQSWIQTGNTQEENTGHNGIQGSGTQGTGAKQQQSVTLPPMSEDKVDVDGGNQTGCAACHLDRIPVDTGGQSEVTWINCDACKRWFHIVCAGFKNDREIRTVDKFICRKCSPFHGRTTFVRKSSRARTAIDYAGLNQGLVKAASDSLEHHYIEPIRQGKIRFLPENFPRMHPDLVTAEHFERGSGWTEPIVIPAHLNSQGSTATSGSDFEALVAEAPTQEMFDELLEHLPEEGHNYERVVDCGQDQLDMVIPKDLTVRAVGELYGPEERVEVIDVKSQQGEDKRWNMRKWVDYYESTGTKVVRNVISLEVSQSRLGRLIRRPKIVRDLDLQDAVWPKELQAVGDFPKVQFYCLMSVADCYTDFHIDFGGSSVYYHILKGSKTFFFIPPKDKHLKKYEEWCNSPAQDNIFLGDQTKECYRVDLHEGDTALIPSGWIHAVWTPANSLVIGGNFLTKLNYGMQIKVANIEKDTKVPRKFRYPFFQKIQWYTALKYLEDDPIPQAVLDSFAQDGNYRFYREYPVYYEFGERANTASPGSPYHNSRFYSQAELEGLPDLTKYLLRTALIASSYTVENVTIEARNAVKRSVPKGVGDPVDTIKKFGIWVAWKRGNEQVPQWTRPGVIEGNPKISLTEKKPAGRPSRRSERNVDNQRMYAERQAVQLPEKQPLPGPASGLSSDALIVPVENSNPMPAKISASSEAAVKEELAPKPRNAPRGSGLGPKRVACDACRKRRIRCNHKDEQNDTSSIRPMANNAFGSIPGLQSQGSFDAASALSSLATVASETGFQGDAGFTGLDPFEAAAKYNQAIVSPSTASAHRFADVSPEGANSGKKGRSKACDDCRKSKRRCIHDEYGRVDPVKAQERSKPRATNPAKRPRQNEEDVHLAANKKPKQESTSPFTRPMNFEPQDGELLPGAQPLTHDHKAVGLDGVSESSKPSPAETLVEADKAGPLGQGSYASPPAVQTDTLVPKETDNMPVSSQPTATLVSPPTSQADETDVPPEHVDGEMTAIHTPTSNSCHSSRQPRHVERPVSEVHIPVKHLELASHPPSSSSSSGRHASFASSAGVRKTSPGPSRKPSSRPTSSHANKSLSPAVAITSPGQSGRSMRRPNEQVDPDSMRLIQQLQGEEFGLRKRSSRT